MTTIITLNSSSELPNLCWHFSNLGCGVDCKECVAPKVKCSVPAGRLTKRRRDVDLARYKYDDKSKPQCDEQGRVIGFEQMMCPKLREALYGS